MLKICVSFWKTIAACLFVGLFLCSFEQSDELLFFFILKTNVQKRKKKRKFYFNSFNFKNRGSYFRFLL